MKRFNKVLQVHKEGNRIDKAVIVLCTALAIAVLTFTFKQAGGAVLDEKKLSNTVGSVKDGRPLVSGYDKEVLDLLSKLRESSRAGVSGSFIIPECKTTAISWRKVLDQKDFTGAAERLINAYSRQEASSEFAGLCAALQGLAGDKGIPGKLIKPQLKLSDAAINELKLLIDAVALSKNPRRDEVMAELLLQAAFGGLTNLKMSCGNGGGFMRQIVPDVVVEKAAQLIDHADPFVRGMAEWTLSVRVAGETAGLNKKYAPKSGKDTAWWKAYMAVSPSQNAENDYVRQIVNIAGHRRVELIHAVAADVVRRAEAKADWLQSRKRLPEAAAASRMALRQSLDSLKKIGSDSIAIHKAYLALRLKARDLVLSDPDLSSGFVFGLRMAPNGFLQPGIHNAENFRAGGNIYVQKGLATDTPLKSVLGDQLKGGGLQGMDLWYDADRVLFSWAMNRAVNIYEIGINGTGLRKLVQSQDSNVDPSYLPDGGVVFGSTRSKAGIMCGNGGLAHTNIYRLMHNSGDVIRLSYCKDDDAYPSVLDDGRVVWMRWDYQERGVNEIFSLWTMNPDGCKSDGFYRVHIPFRETIQALRYPRQIAGTPYLVAAGGSHHMGGVGTIVLIDPRAGINNPDGMRNVTPNITPIEYGWNGLKPVAEGGVPYIGGYYSNPHGLSEKTFLVTYSYDQPSACNGGGYYIDVWGNQELLRRDPVMEVTFLRPLIKRNKPVIIPDSRDPKKVFATCLVDNVYKDLPGVKAGEVKYLRILEQMFWLNGAVSEGPYSYSGGTGEGLTRVIGTVPVEPDGSAVFEVPSGAPIYFQALDKNYMGIQRMRTHVTLAPGEFRGCVGCHETRSETVSPRVQATAYKKSPVRPTPPAWGDSTFINYETMIQPIFEAKCVKCHSGSNPKGKLLLTADKGPDKLMQSFRSLFGFGTKGTIPVNAPGAAPRDISNIAMWNPMVKSVTAFLNETKGEVTQPKQFGSPKAPLAIKLAGDPKHRELVTEAEMQLLMTWLDVRTPYIDTYVERKGSTKIVRLKPFAPFGEVREHILVKK